MFVDPYIASNSIKLASSSHQATFPWRKLCCKYPGKWWTQKDIAGNDCSQLNANNCFFLFSLSLSLSHFIYVCMNHLIYILHAVCMYISYIQKILKKLFVMSFLQKHHNIIVFQARFVDLHTTYQAQKHTGDEISLSTAGHTSASAPSTSTSHANISRYPPVIQSNIGWKSPLSYAIYKSCGFSMAMLFLSWKAKGTLFTSLNPGILDQDDQVKATLENSPSSFATRKRNSRCFIEIPRFPQLISIHNLLFKHNCMPSPL